MNNKQFKHINTQYLFELGDNDPDFVKDIVGDLLVAVPESIHNIEAAISVSDNDAIVFLAHKLKGTFRFVGNNTLGDIMERIEKEALSMDEVSQLMQVVKEGYLLSEKEFKELLQSI